MLTLIERTAEEVGAEEVLSAQERMRQGRLTLDDFVIQLRQIRKLGPLESILGMMPGGRELMRSNGAAMPDEHQLSRIEAIVLSMTPHERRHPELVDASRRRRIASGSGTSTVEVSRLIKSFDKMQVMMKSLMGTGGKRRMAQQLLQGPGGLPLLKG